MRELNLTEKYVLFLILHEVKDRWSKNRVYQDLQTWLNEEMEKFIKKMPEIDFSKEYDCKWENPIQ